MARDLGMRYSPRIGWVSISRGGSYGYYTVIKSDVWYTFDTGREAWNFYRHNRNTTN